MPISDPEARRAYQREWRAKRRAEWLTDKACVICGSVDYLEVDHVDPEQKVSHKVWSWSQERRDEELAKCQVLCGDHHREKTAAWRAAVPIQHGTLGGYGRRACRCPECTAVHSEYNRQWRSRTLGG